MISLIKNEFIKLLKKKSTYIVLIVTLLFIILINFLCKYSNSNNYRYSGEEINYYSELLKSLDPNNPDEVESYVEIKTQFDVVNLISKYGFDSWQSKIIPEKIYSYINSINFYTYIEKDEKALTSAKQEYNKLVDILDSNNWKYFVNLELEELNKKNNDDEKAKLAVTDKASLKEANYILDINKIEKQVLMWRLEKDIPYNDNNFLNTALEAYSRNAKRVCTYEKDTISSYSEKLEYYSCLEMANINKYYVENNVINLREDDNRDILVNLLDKYELFILIFVIMISGAIVSDEFSKGTIKLLLVRPYSRLKLLFAKFVTCICLLILFIVFVSVCQLLIGGLVQGFNCLRVPAVVYNYNTNNIETMSIAKHIAITTCAKLPMYLLLMTLAFTISTLFNNSALAIALPLLGYMVSPIINQLASYALLRDIKILLYFVTPNWDLTSYLFGGLPMFEQLTLPFSITICLVYFLIMVLASAIVFKKRNIKNV